MGTSAKRELIQPCCPAVCPPRPRVPDPVRWASCGGGFSYRRTATPARRRDPNQSLARCQPRRLLINGLQPRLRKIFAHLRCPPEARRFGAELVMPFALERPRQ